MGGLHRGGRRPVRHGRDLRRRGERAHHRPPAGRRPVGARTRWSSPPSSCRARGSWRSPRRWSARPGPPLARLGIDSIDLYQIHGPISLRSHGAMADALAAAHAEGLIKAVGVSNYSVKETRAMDAALAEAGPAAGQQPDRVLAPAHHAREGRSARVLPGAGRGAAGLLAHRPGPPDRQVLAPPTRRPRAGRSRTTRWRRWTRSWRSCAASGRPTASARRARWPWPGSSPRAPSPSPAPRTGAQAEENAGALGWRMDDAEVAALDAVALYGTRGISQRIWQHG